MGAIWIAFAALLVLAGVRYGVRMRAARSSGAPPRVDDAALRDILRKGTIVAPDDEEPLDLEEVARAEEEFWSEPWDEPEEGFS